MKWKVALVVAWLGVATAADELGKVRGCVANLKQIGGGLESYASDHGGRYPGQLGELVPTYLKTVPVCPVAGRDTYSRPYELRGPERYFVCCAGSHHRSAGLQQDQPTLDSRNWIGPASLLVRLQKQDDRSRPRASLEQCCGNLKKMATALEMYAVDHGGRYPKRLEALAESYLHPMPLCLGRNTYVYAVGTSPDRYTVHCHGKNHVHQGSPADLPAYSSRTGLRRE